VGAKVNILTRVAKHFAFGVLAVMLACSPLMAEESANEKNESVEERYILEERSAPRRILAGGNEKPLYGSAPSSLSFTLPPDITNQPVCPKLFILYHNLKLCD